jgi:signal transduction histidine kinase
LKKYIAAGLLLAGGIAIGALITTSPIQSRVPGGGAPPMLPTLLPFAAAALSFPLFLWLAQLAPLSRSNWRSIPIWLITLLVVSFVADAIVFAIIARHMPRLEPLPFILIRLTTTGPIIAMSAAAALAIEHANARAALSRAQLRSLTAQLRPHFLFNTLQSISTLVHRDAHAADRMIGQLADLLRASLDLDGRTLVPLARELEITENYLAIVRERFGPRLSARLESTAPADVLVPPFLLQPLVENAVQHGVEASPAGGTVHVNVFRDADMLVLEVHDTGSDGANTDAAATSGIGLSTTRQRLNAIYGARADLDIKVETTGTVVRVMLPLQT